MLCILCHHRLYDHTGRVALAPWRRVCFVFFCFFWFSAFCLVPCTSISSFFAPLLCAVFLSPVRLLPVVCLSSSLIKQITSLSLSLRLSLYLPLSESLCLSLPFKRLSELAELFV